MCICVTFCAAQVPDYVVQRLQRVRDAGGNQAERKRRARLLALLAALIRVSTTTTSLPLHSTLRSIKTAQDPCTAMIFCQLIYTCAIQVLVYWPSSSVTVIHCCWCCHASYVPAVQLASGRPKLVVRPPQPAVEGEDGETRPARAGGLEALAASLRIGRQQVLELLLDKFYDKRWVTCTASVLCW
jgi:hypothetical protein